MNMSTDMKCGPDNCPLTAWAALSPSERKVQRQPLARKLYEQGFTPETIAEQFGVSLATTYRDLEFSHDEKTQSPRKSKRGREGEGRPKGSNKLQPQRRKNTSTSAEAAARLILEDGKSYAEVERQTGLSNIVLRSAVAREEGRREPPTITPDMLSMTARQKLDTAVRQHRHKLEAEFTQRVAAQVKRLFEDVWLPDYQKRLDDAQAISDAYRGLWPRAIYRKILACLHPDGRKTVTEKLLAEAFHAFNSINEVVLVKADERPRDPRIELPSTVEGWMERKRQVQEKRRAKRAAQQHPGKQQQLGA